VPRAVTTSLRPSRLVIRRLWHLWPSLTYALFRDQGKREDFLSTFAPMQLVLLLAIWVAMLLLGWGLVFYGLRDQLKPPGVDFGAALYYAGASLLTIGYGDIVAHTALTRVLSLAAAASGLGVVAVVTSFLFAVFGAFQSRERFVVTVGARAGVPPSGVGLLEVHAYAALRDDLAVVFREAQSWAAGLMETHLAYPILLFFRSSHDYQSWVGTLGTMMDGAVLVLTTLDRDDMRNTQSIGQAQILYEVGRHLARDFSEYFVFMGRMPQDSAGIERTEFSAACERLLRAGYKLREEQTAWSEFETLRKTYGPHLNALARWLEIPPVQWIGDRTLITPH
jgi:hypothetical protein